MVSLFVEATCELGEGPVWDKTRQCLWWVDIMNKTIYRASATGDSVRSWVVDELVGFVLPHPDGTLWAGMHSGLHRLTLSADDELSVKRLTYLDTPHGRRVRFNDACVDERGGLYATTMDMDAQDTLGALHYYADFDQTEPTVLLDGFVIGNGPTLSRDEKTLYVNETNGHPSRAKGVYAAPVLADGRLGQATLLIDWSHYDGHPDGITTDHAGNLWIGGYGTHCVFGFSPTGTLLRQIDAPALNITKPAFGPDPHTLFVTSARQELSEEQLAEYPQTGSVWRIDL